MEVDPSVGLLAVGLGVVERPERPEPEEGLVVDPVAGVLDLAVAEFDQTVGVEGLGNRN